jgi:CBS domain-containing protein
MTHTVRDWMSSPVVVVDKDTSVSHAMTLMRRRNIHSVVVDGGEESKGYGIVTSTDIMDKIVAQGRNPANTRLSDIMSGPVITGKPDWTLMECSRVMQEHNFHHLPIADEHGTLVGLISSTDIFVAVEEVGWVGGIEDLKEAVPSEVLRGRRDHNG